MSNIIEPLPIVQNINRDFFHFQHQPTRAQKIIQVVALAALAALVIAVATVTGLFLGGVIVAAIAALSTAVVATITAVVYRILQMRQEKKDPAQAFKTFLETLGTLDPLMIIPRKRNCPSLYVIHRENGNAALVTSGLWDPKNPKNGFELFLEIPESQLADLKKCEKLEAFAKGITEVQSKIDDLTEVFQKKEYEIIGNNPTTSMLLGIDASSKKKCPVPMFFRGPNDIKVPIITAKALTYIEWQNCYNFTLGKKGLVKHFKKNGTFHVSDSTKEILKQPLPAKEWTIKRLEEVVSGQGHAKTLEKLVDLEHYTCPIPVASIINKFESSHIAQSLKDLTDLTRTLMKNSSTDPLLNLGCASITNLLNCQAKFLNYMQFYKEKRKLDRHLNSNAISQFKKDPSELFEDMQTLQNNAMDLLERFVQRTEWVQEIFKREGESFDAELCLKCLALDTNLMNDIYHVIVNMNDATFIFENYYLSYIQSTKTIPWPHHFKIETELEATGFEFRPTILQQDRCVCSICKVEVFGWRSWYDPDMFHDRSKHP